MGRPEVQTPTGRAAWGREGKNLDATQQKREGRLSERCGKSSKAGGRLCSEVLGAWGPPLPLAPREGEPPRTARGQGEGQHPGTGTVAGTEAAGHSSGHGRRAEGAQHGFAGRTAPRQSSKTRGLTLTGGPMEHKCGQSHPFTPSWGNLWWWLRKQMLC